MYLAIKKRTPLIKSAGVFALTIFISCNDSKIHTKETGDSAQTITLTDSSREGVVKVMDSLIALSTEPGDTIISAEFVRQWQDNDGIYYLTVKMANDGLIVLTNPTPLDQHLISKLKKHGDNLILSYSLLDQTINRLGTVWEPKK